MFCVKCHINLSIISTVPYIYQEKYYVMSTDSQRCDMLFYY